jgi:hypothetical protein
MSCWPARSISMKTTAAPSSIATYTIAVHIKSASRSAPCGLRLAAFWQEELVCLVLRDLGRRAGAPGGDPLLAFNYGFHVTPEGLGASSFDVRQDGAAFGVVNGTTLNVFQLLKGVNERAVNGVLYPGAANLRTLAEDLFERLNRAGA